MKLFLRRGKSHVVIHGGVNADGQVTDTLGMFDLSANSWRVIAAEGEAPGPRQQHSMVTKDTTVFIFGGMSSIDGTPQSDVWMFDAGASPSPRWLGQVSATGDAPGGRAGSAVALLGGSLVVFGGQGEDGNPTDNVYEMSSETLAWTLAKTQGDVPMPRMLSSANVIEEKLWLVGGETEVGRKLKDTWEFDLTNDKWKQHTPTAVAASDSASMFTCGATTTAAAGAGNGEGVVSTEESVEWPTPRSGLATAVARDEQSLCGDGSIGSSTIFAFGGTGADDIALNDLWSWCPATQQWKSISLVNEGTSHPPSARSSAALVASGDRSVVIFGGMTGERARLNDIWKCNYDTGVCNEMKTLGGSKPHTRRGMGLYTHYNKGVTDLLVFGGYWKEKSACATCGGVVRYMDRDKSVDLWRYQSKYERWKKTFANNAPDQRYLSAAAVEGDTLFMHGGYAMDGLMEHSDFWSFDVVNQQWQRLPALVDGKGGGEGEGCPEGRHGHTINIMTSTNGEAKKAVVFGGAGLNGLISDVWVTDVSDITGHAGEANDEALALATTDSNTADVSTSAPGGGRPGGPKHGHHNHHHATRMVHVVA